MSRTSLHVDAGSILGRAILRLEEQGFLPLAADVDDVKTAVEELLKASRDMRRWLVRPKRRTTENWMTSLDGRRSAANDAFESSLSAFGDDP